MTATSDEPQQEAGSLAPKMGWLEALAVYLKPQVITMLFLGFAAGLPFLLVFTTLTLWLAELDIKKATIGYFAWVGITYSIKVFWAPIVDRVPLPALTAAMGKRRSWMLLAQAGIAAGLIGMALTNPAESIEQMAFFALLVAFSSATQDITIDAYRIEAAQIEYQGAMSATYQLGYRIAMIVAGAGALYFAQFWSWPVAYMIMAACVLVGVLTVLSIREPEHRPIERVVLESETKRRQVMWNFIGIAGVLAAIGFYGWSQSTNILLQSVFTGLMILAAGLVLLAYLARQNQAAELVGWFDQAVIEPLLDFFKRFGWVAIVILVFVSIYRLSDISMGAMANPLYYELGYTKIEIANVAKLYGVVLSMIGAFVGGILVVRYGLSWPLILGAALVSATNLVFAWLATTNAEIAHLMLAISADNFSAGVAGSVFIAFLSSLVSQKYTATQYALFSSLFTLPGKFIAGLSGNVVEFFTATSAGDELRGFYYFFFYVAALGIPAVLLAWFMTANRTLRTSIASGQRAAAAAGEPEARPAS